MSIVDLAARRFQRTRSASEVSSRDAIVEALRRFDSGEWKPESVIIIGMEVDHENSGTSIEIIGGGPATNNDRLAMCARCSHMTIMNMTGEISSE